MKYFDYQEKQMGNVWELFRELIDVPVDEILGKTQSNTVEFGHSLDIIIAATQGRIRMGEEDTFDLRAYESKCYMSEYLTNAKNRSKYLSLVDDSGVKEDGAGYGEISSNDIKVFEDGFSAVEMEESFEACLSVLYNLKSDYIVSKGVDIVELIRGALSGIPESIKKIQILSKADENLSAIIETLCEGSVDGSLYEKLAYL